MKERIIVSMTSYGPRLTNIPGVLNSIYAQTRQPDLVVLNLAYDELLPDDVQKYIEEHCVEVNRVPDTKVYKKLIPTLKKYPEDCIITIDDDFLYPQGMIEDFMSIHSQYPDFPISGNREVLWGLQCHCGCASLMKASYWGDYINCIDDEVIGNCASDDVVYTFFCNKNGHPYVRTKNLYYLNMEHYHEGIGYSVYVYDANGIPDTYSYLRERFGSIRNNTELYVRNDHLTNIIIDIENSYREMGRNEGRDDIYATYSYRIGHFILKPMRFLRKYFQTTWFL